MDLSFPDEMAEEELKFPMSTRPDQTRSKANYVLGKLTTERGDRPTLDDVGKNVLEGMNAAVGSWSGAKGLSVVNIRHAMDSHFKPGP